MKKNIKSTSSNMCKCYACGHNRPQSAVRPFGRLGDRVVSWICLGCDLTPSLAHAAPTHPSLEVAR